MVPRRDEEEFGMLRAHSRAAALVLSGAVLAGCSSPDGTSSGASCAAPRTTASAMQARPGQAVQVSAASMWAGCNDQGFDDPLPPLLDQPVIWRQAGADVELTRVDADPGSGHAQATVRVPVTARPGKAQLQLGTSSQAVTIIVRAGSTGTGCNGRGPLSSVDQFGCLTGARWFTCWS
jgi:hypothetical protein